MTRDEAVTFLTDAGHLVSVEDFDVAHACVAFKYRGTSLKLFTNADDPDFFFLVCSCSLVPFDRDELAVARILSDVQLNLKVVKLSVDLNAYYVAASAEQFVPNCDAFARIFWRSAELIVHAAKRATSEIHALGSTNAAAQRFTAAMEAELQLDRDRDR